MRNFIAVALSFAFLLLPLPQEAFADNDADAGDLSSKFTARVKAARNLPDGAAKWSALAKDLAANPMFDALGLDKLVFDKGNQLTYDYDLELGDTELDLKGVLSFNPAPAAGEPVASLISKTQNHNASGDLIDIGALHSTSANMEVFIYKEGGAYRFYARVLPNFTNYNRDPHPALMLAKTRAGLDFELVGADIALKDLLPFARPLPFYNQFSFNSLSRAGTVYTIKGAVNGRAITVTADNARKTLLLTGNSLTLADFFPDAAALPLLNNFAFQNFSQDAGGIAAAGSLNGRKVTVARGADKTSFTLTGAGLKLADFVPAAAKAPVLAGFAFQSMTWTPSSVTVNGTVGGKAASVAADSDGQTYTIAGDDLNLKDFIPETANTPVLNTFAFMHLMQYPTGFSVLGHINGTEVTVTKDVAAKTYTVTSLGLKLADFIPAAGKVQFLNAFEFVSAGRSPTATQVAGRLSGKNVSVITSAAGFTVTGDGLTLKDILPQAASLASLNNFAFESYSYSAGNTAVTGKVNGKALLVKKNADDAALLISGEDLKLADFVPETSQLAYLDNFALDTVKCSPSEFIVTGKVNAKAVTVDDHITSNNFKVTGDGLKVTDFIPQAAGVAYLNNFAFDSLTHTADGIAVAGRVNGKGVTVSHNLTDKAFTVKGDSLKLADFVPAAAKLDYLDNFAFLDLVYTEATLEVAGTVNGKNIAVVQDNVTKLFTLTGSALQLADFVPAAKGLPYLQKFDLKRVVQRPNGALVDGDVDGKALSVDADLSANTFKVTGDNLLLKDFIPEAAGWTYLNNFKFDSLLSTLADITVTGKVNDKAVAVKKTLNSPNFSVTGADLQLADFIPEAAEVPCVSAFALDRVLRSDTEASIAGKVDGKPVGITASFADNSIEMTGLGLSLPTCVPFSLNLPALKWFSFGNLFHWPDRIEVNGTINGKAVKLVWVFSPKVITVTGDSLQLADFIPETAKIPLLNSFDFLSLEYTDATLTVSGTIKDKNVSVLKDNAAKTIKVTGDDLKLADFVPEAADVPFLKSFAFDSLAYTPAAIVVDGKLNGKKVSVTRHFGPAVTFTAAGEGLTLNDIVPEAGGIKAFDALALNLVSVTAEAVQVDGALNGKAVRFVRTRGAKPVATVTAAGMVLGDLYAPLASLPAVNAVAVTKISLDGSSVEAEAKLNGVLVDVTAHANQNADGAYVSVFFDSLSAATFIPAAQGHLVNDLSLEKALFIIQPAGSPARAVAAADLPGDLPKLVNWPAGTALNLAEGVNLAATISTAKSGKLADAFKTVGLPPASVFVKGTLSQNTFKGMTPGSALADADKQAILAGLDLSVDLPLPTLPAIGGMVTVKGPVTLNIGGDARNKSSLWARVPAAIATSKPKGDLDVSVQFQLDIVGAGIGEKLDALVSLDKGARGGLSLLALYEGTWKQPFGIQGLTLADGGFEFALDGKDAAAKSSLAFFATAMIGARNVAVTADLKRADNKLSLDYFELDGKFRLADFPGGKNIPSGDKFELDQLKLSVNGIEAKTVLAGNKVNAYLFNAGAAATPNWVFALNQKNFKITELLPAAKTVKPLAAMTIPNAALIISEKGLKNADRNSLGVIAKDMFDGILGKSNVAINLPDGIGLLAEFDANAMGVVGKGLNGIGVHDDAIIMGAVTGVFQGNPGVMLSLAMENAGAAKGLPGKIMSFKPGVPPAYFIQWAGPDLYAGLRTAVLVKAGKENIDFTTDIELQFGETGAGVKILGEKNGPWKQPFGIKGLTLNNVKMDVAITPVGEVQFGAAGDQQYGNCHDLKSKDCVDVDLAMSVKVPLEAGLPDGVAFSGKVNPLSIPALMEITETLMSVPPGSIAKLPVPFFQINNAQLAFATPGASDPQLGLVSDGFAFAGNFFFMNKDLGHVTGAGGPAGLRIKGAIGDIDLEVLKFTDNTIDISLNQDPKYIINANVTLLGAPQKVAIDIKPPHFAFDMTEKLGEFGNALLTVTMDGFDLKKGTFDKNAGISVVGEFQSTLVPWMKGEVKKGVEDLRNSAKAKFEADNKALNDAMDKVNQLTAKIQKLKEEDQKAKDRADDALNSAKSRVDSLWDRHEHEQHEAHHCGSKWTHWACSPGWRIAAASTWVIYEVAEKSLDAAKKAVAAATNLDPRVAALLAERDIERAGLTVAKAVVKVAEDVEDFVMKELETVLERAISDMPLEIDKAYIVGDLKDLVTHNDPLVLDMKFKLAGAPMHEFFAVKVPVNEANAQFDAGSFALLPALAMDKLTENALSKLSPEAARWVHSHIASQIADAEGVVREAVEAQEEKYKDVLATFDNGTAKYKKAFADQGDDHLKLVEAMDVSDLMPNSLQYTDIYLAIGHSSLCLAVSKDGLNVVQLPCKDADVQQWSTTALKDEAAGYVELKNKGLCLKARQGDERDGFEPLILSQCDQDDLHEQWKVISADGYYDEIVNRASQKCLHFDKEDANPESAFAKWTSCLGTDSQTFRDITDAEKPTWHKVESMVKAANGLCLDVVEPAENSVKLTPDAKEIKLYAHKCGDGSERFNYIEEVDGDIRLVHTETGGCVYPQEKATTLAIRACDRGEDMFWRINSKSANADQFYIAPRNACMTLPAPPKGATQDLEAGIADCNIVPNDSTLLELTK
jgi:hypothetical protein